MHGNQMCRVNICIYFQGHLCSFPILTQFSPTSIPKPDAQLDKRLPIKLGSNTALQLSTGFRAAGTAHSSFSLHQFFQSRQSSLRQTLNWETGRELPSN